LWLVVRKCSSGRCGWKAPAAGADQPDRAQSLLRPNGADHRSHAVLNGAVAAYIRWRNTRAQPMTSFATDTPIRT